jgi:hypothetical protein
MNTLTEQIIVDILKTKMTLDDSRVWVRDQTRKIPNGEGVYIVVGMVSGQVMSAETYLVDSQDGGLVWDTPGLVFDTEGLFYADGVVPANYDMGAGNYDEGLFWDDSGGEPVILQSEITETLVQETIQVDIFSRDNTALLNRWRIITSLNTIYAKQKQEENSFKMARIPTGFINTSVAEGSSNLNRFTLTIPCLVWYREAKLLSETGEGYYDDFKTRVDDQKSIGTDHGIIEFEIQGSVVS